MEFRVESNHIIIIYSILYIIIWIKQNLPEKIMYFIINDIYVTMGNLY